MVFTKPSLVAFFALSAWRFVFTSVRRRLLASEIAAPQQQRTNILEPGLDISNLPGVAAIPDNRIANGSDAVHRISRKDRPKIYLRRIVALTGATQEGNEYILNVGTTRFHVRDRYVGRMRDSTDPKCGYEETCFYSAHKEMPKSEHIATALLQLKNNPALFDRWASRSGAFKADGQGFSAAQ
jgi:hypothetical protein